MKLLPFLLCFSLTITEANASVGGNELTFPRHPALSPDANKVAFSHQGDIWVANLGDGNARRITAHDAYDGSPMWSPDGSKIAFLSQRFGNNDVFVVPADGGQITRISFHSEHEKIHSWIDNESILIGKTGTRWYARRGQGAWVAHLDGRTPSLLIDEAILRADSFDGGRKVVYERGHGQPHRRAYRGPATSALWIWDAASGEHRELTTFDGNDLHPMWSPTGNHVYFSSDRACKGNEDGRELGLWQIDTVSGRAELVFNDGEQSIRNPNISRDGSKVVAELGTSLVLIDTINGSSRQVNVYGSFDPSLPNQSTEIANGGASDLAISPDGESIAFVSDGDVYVMRKHEKIKRCVRVTTSVDPDYSPIWIDEGKALLFVSERDGNGEFYKAMPKAEDTEFYKAREFVITRLTETANDESAPALSPDGKRLAWIQSPGSLVVGSPDTFEIERTLASGFEAPSFEWAPDSKWVAWSAVNDDFNYDIFVGRADVDFEAVNLTVHPDDDTNPHWSPDGRKLAFTSRRQMLDETDVYVAWLRQEDVDRSKRDRLEAEEAKKKEKKKGDDGKKDKKEEVEKEDKEGEEVEGDKGDEVEVEEDTPAAQIDFDDISLRLQRLTRMEANERSLGWNADSDQVFFNASLGTRLTTGTSGETGFYQVNIWDRKAKELDKTTVSNFVGGGKTVFYTKSGKITGRDSKATEYSFSVRRRVDRTALMVAIVKEGWRALDRMFYDPEFHGHNWADSLKKWQPIAAAASTAEDFGLAMNWMLGEMNASHMGYYGGGSTRAKETDNQITAALGVMWDSAHAGPGRKVAEVLKGMPAARSISRLEKGDVVLAVDGVEYHAGDNWAQLMMGKAGEDCWLSVQDSAGEKREVLIRPAAWSAIRSAMYRRHEDMARTKVEMNSRNRLGYIHIEGMGQGSLLEFERDLFRAANGKDGLLIDVRENGGGWTTDMVLAMLMVKDHAITIPRGGGEGYPQGRRIFATWDKPVVVLCNENSYSNAEIFSWSIKTLGRGPIVGKQTYGAVISTGASFLQNGAYVRLPFRGWYVNNDERTNMELNGCPPDYPVENLPGDYAKGIDRQLDKAIEVGLGLLN